MALSLITAPTSEPLTLAEVRAQCRISSADGEPAPSAPTIALISPAVAGALTAGVYSARVTFVTADGETDGGVVSATATVADPAVNGKLAWSAIPTGGSAVTSRKLYRTVANGSTYKLVATLADNTTTTYTDNIADAALGVGVPTTNTTEDPFLTRLLKTARRHLDAKEGWLNLCFMTQTWDLLLDCFPAVIWLPLAPVQSITHVKYYDSTNTLQTFSSASYETDLVSEPGRIALVSGASWPTTYSRMHAVSVRMVCGWTTAAAVPDPIKHAMAMLIAHWNEHREAVLQGTISKEIELSVRNLLAPVRMHPRTTS